MGSVPVAESVGSKTTQDIRGRSHLWQRDRRGVPLEIHYFGRLARGQQQDAGMVQWLDAIDPETLGQTPVTIEGALVLRSPQLEVSVLAHTRDELCRLGGGDGPDLVGVAAQHLGFGPGTGVPEADGLIQRCRDQMSSVP